MVNKIVIIGGNAAGSTAASSARKTDRKAEITVIESEKYPGYSRCGLPFVLSDEIENFENLIVFPESWYKMINLDLRLETDAKKIDTEEKTVCVEKNGEEEVIKYDSLILATGARAFIPPIKGYDKEGVYPLRTIEDGKVLQNKLKKVKSAAIVGAGLIGLEMAHSLHEKDIETTVVEMLPYVCPAMLDRDMANIVAKRISDKGVEIIVGQGVEEITGNGKVAGIVVGGEEKSVDMVLMATGVRARTELASQIGAQFGVTRGIKVNNLMATSVPNVYACGDCVESYSLINWQPLISQLGTTAVRQARVAGTNAAGGYATFPGVLSSAVSKIFDFEVGSTGFTGFQAQRMGYQTVSGAITGKTRAPYFPYGEDIRVKIVVEKEMGRVIGGQIISGEEVTQRINMISIGIQKHMTVQELSKADTCYAPPVNETIEAVTLAAEIAVTRLSRRR